MTRKILAILTVISMLACSFVNVSAQDTTSDWNYNLIAQGEEALYEQFPMAIDKVINRDMAMNLIFTYLKTDSATVTVTDAYTNEQIISKAVDSTDNSVVLENVPNDTTYCVTVDGYTGYVTTQYSTADFPVDITLGNTQISNNNGETFEDVKIKKVGDNPSCTHSEDEECGDSCSIFNYIDIVAPEQLGSLYSTLDANSYYEMQMEATRNNVSELYRGYISTYPDGDDLGIFTRGFKFAHTLNPQPLASTYALNSTPDFSNALQYKTYENIYIRNFTSGDEYVAKFIPENDKQYTIETIGNANTIIKVYIENNGVINDNYSIIRDGGVGDNASGNIRWLVDDTHKPVVYVVISCLNNDYMSAAFRIIPQKYSSSDDFTNYRDVVFDNYAAGNYSAAENTGCKINYFGDVDMFAYDVNAGNGYVSLTQSNSLVKATIYTADSTTDHYTSMWQEGTVTSNDAGSLQSMTFSKDMHLVKVEQALPKDYSLVPNDDIYDFDKISYDFKFYDPKHEDSLEYSAGGEYSNNFIMYATQISAFPYDIKDVLTIHRNDTDYFTFTTGANGGDVEITVSNSQYEILLIDSTDVEILSYDPPRWSEDAFIAESTVADGISKLNYSNLAANHQYYIYVSAISSSIYDCYTTYNLFASITEPQIPTAVLSGDVALAHTEGSDITSLDAFKNTIMQSLTCSINGVAVDDATAVNDVTLYIGDEELTTSMVNIMTAGASHTIIPKYQGVAATGGTVTLTVSEAVSSNSVLITTVNNASVSIPQWDWAGAAMMIANARLVREGSPVTTKTVVQAVQTIKSSAPTSRGTDTETAEAANFFYTNGSTGTMNFFPADVELSNAESTLFNSISQGKPVIMVLTSKTSPDDMSLARYIVLVGVDITNHTYSIMDPIDTSNDIITIEQTVINNGGYDGNSDLEFTGTIIELF